MSYIVAENDIKGTVLDFITFCDFIENNKTYATQKGDLSQKACYAVNQLLKHPLKTAKDTNRMQHYPSVSLWFHISKESGLINCDNDSGSKIVFSITNSYHRFKEMSIFSQYLLIFNTWFCFVDIEALYKERGSTYIISQIIDIVFAQLRLHDSAKWIKYYQNRHSFFDSSPVQIMMEHYYKTAHNLMDLGLITFTEGDALSKYYNNPVIEKINSTRLGTCVFKACECRKYTQFNVFVETVFDDDEIDIDEDTTDKIETNTETFLTPFLSYFPQEAIDISAINGILYEYKDKNNDTRKFYFKVSLNKKCYRIIRCLPHHTFEDLHLAIQEAFDFDNDHLYSFYLDGKRYSNYSVNSLYSDNPPYANEVCLRDIRLKDKQHILYLFDYGDCWEFEIVLDIKTDESINFISPEIIKTVGKAPEQYPSYDKF